MDTLSDSKLALVDINAPPYDNRTARVKEWLESPAARHFHLHFNAAVNDANYDLKSRLDSQHMRKMALNVRGRHLERESGRR
ncbi:hypothetical protein C0991_012440 [Blastosporella zonata]|nr:hypothetical protein C0991_012440 [Blastosporella zonata]